MTTYQKLELVKDRQQAFKPSVMRQMSCRIVQAALMRECVWADEVPHEDIGVKDRNCIGSAFRFLNNLGVIERGTDFRPSQAPNANGRTIFSYHLTNRHLAHTFLSRNGAYTKQAEMSL